MFNKNDPILESVRKVMERGNLVRSIQTALNEELGIVAKRQLPHEQHAMYEQVYAEILEEATSETNLQEVSKEKLLKYKQKAGNQALDLADKADDANIVAVRTRDYDKHVKYSDIRDAADDKRNKRLDGRDLANKKLTGRAKVNANEETLNELSKDKLSSYIRGATREKELGIKGKPDRTDSVNLAVSKKYSSVTGARVKAGDEKKKVNENSVDESMGMKKFRRSAKGPGNPTGDPREIKKRLQSRDPDFIKDVASREGKLHGPAELQRRLAKKMVKENKDAMRDMLASLTTGKQASKVPAGANSGIKGSQWRKASFSGKKIAAKKTILNDPHDLAPSATFKGTHTGKRKNLDEVSREKLNSYVSKASKDLKKTRSEFKAGAVKKMEKRLDGISNATSKLKKTAKVNANEENLQELSKQKLGKYINANAASKGNYAKREKGMNLATNKVLANKVKVPATGNFTINEASRKKLEKYVQGSMSDWSHQDAVSKHANTDAEKEKGSNLKSKRAKGISKAIDKLSGDAKVNANEENLQELSKKKLGNYMGKSNDDSHNRFMKQLHGDSDETNDRKLYNRRVGQLRATGKIQRKEPHKWFKDGKAPPMPKHYDVKKGPYDNVLEESSKELLNSYIAKAKKSMSANSKDLESHYKRSPGLIRALGKVQGLNYGKEQIKVHATDKKDIKEAVINELTSKGRGLDAVRKTWQDREHKAAAVVRGHDIHLTARPKVLSEPSKAHDDAAAANHAQNQIKKKVNRAASLVRKRGELRNTGKSSPETNAWVKSAKENDKRKPVEEAHAPDLKHKATTGATHVRQAIRDKLGNQSTKGGKRYKVTKEENGEVSTGKSKIDFEPEQKTLYGY